MMVAGSRRPSARDWWTIQAAERALLSRPRSDCWTSTPPPRGLSLLSGGAGAAPRRPCAGGGVRLGKGGVSPGGGGGRAFSAWVRGGGRPRVGQGVLNWGGGLEFFGLSLPPRPRRRVL